MNPHVKSALSEFDAKNLRMSEVFCSHYASMLENVLILSPQNSWYARPHAALKDLVMMKDRNINCLDELRLNGSAFAVTNYQEHR